MTTSAAHVIVGSQRIHGVQELVHEDKRADDDEPAQHCPQPEIPRRHARLHASSILFAPNTPTDLMHPDVHGNSNSQRRDHQGDEPEIHSTSAVPPRCDDIEVLAGPGQHPDVVDAEGDYPQQNVLEQGPVGVKSAYLKRRSARLRDTARVTWLLALGQRLTIGLPILVRIRLGRERNLAALRRNIGFRIE